MNIWKYIKRGYIVIILVLGLIITAIYLWDFRYGVDRQLLSGVISGLVIVGFTVFGVDKFQRRREKKRWETAKLNVLMELDIYLNAMITDTRVLMKIDLEDINLPSRRLTSELEWHKNVSRQLLEYVEKLIQNRKQELILRVKSCQPESWYEYIKAMKLNINRVEATMAIFPAITSQPELINEIMTVRRSYEAVYTLWEAVPFVLGVPLEKQPGVKNGNKATRRDEIHNIAAEYIEELIIKVIHAKKFILKLLEEST